MDRNKKTMCLGLSLIILNACGGQKPITNQQSVDAFSALVTAHPELARANLKQIKHAAGQDDPLLLVFSSSVASSHGAPFSEASISSGEEGKEESGKELSAEKVDLQQSVAENAQKLIDDIIDNYDFSAQFDASVKLTGIGMNKIKRALEMSQNSSLLGGGRKKSFGKDDPFGGELEDKPFDISEILNKIPTCDQVINDPFTEFSKESFEESSEQNREAMRKTISGCPKINGKQFATCMQTANQWARTVNEHATCQDGSFGAFKKRMKSINNDFGKTDILLNKCMNELFASCEYDPKQVEQKDSPWASRSKNLVHGPELD